MLATVTTRGEFIQEVYYGFSGPFPHQGTLETELAADLLGAMVELNAHDPESPTHISNMFIGAPVVKHTDGQRFVEDVEGTGALALATREKISRFSWGNNSDGMLDTRESAVLGAALIWARNLRFNRSIKPGALTPGQAVLLNTARRAEQSLGVALDLKHTAYLVGTNVMKQEVVEKRKRNKAGVFVPSLKDINRITEADIVADGQLKRLRRGDVVAANDVSYEVDAAEHVVAAIVTARAVYRMQKTLVGVNGDTRWPRILS